MSISNRFKKNWAVSIEWCFNKYDQSRFALSIIIRWVENISFRQVSGWYLILELPAIIKLKAIDKLHIVTVVIKLTYVNRSVHEIIGVDCGLKHVLKHSEIEVIKFQNSLQRVSICPNFGKIFKKKAANLVDYARFWKWKS